MNAQEDSWGHDQGGIAYWYKLLYRRMLLGYSWFELGVLVNFRSRDSVWDLLHSLLPVDPWWFRDLFLTHTADTHTTPKNISVGGADAVPSIVVLVVVVVESWSDLASLDKLPIPFRHWVSLSWWTDDDRTRDSARAIFFAGSCSYSAAIQSDTLLRKYIPIIGAASAYFFHSSRLYLQFTVLVRSRIGFCLWQTPEHLNSLLGNVRYIGVTIVSGEGVTIVHFVP